MNRRGSLDDVIVPLIIMSVMVITAFGVKLYEDSLFHTVRYQSVVVECRKNEFPCFLTYQEKKVRIEFNGTVWVNEGTSEVKPK